MSVPMPGHGGKALKWSSENVPIGQPGPYGRLHAVDAELDRLEMRTALSALGLVETISTR